jgi:hypothetical protein
MAEPSDDEREEVVRALTRHCGDGRLTLDELEDRVTEAYGAMTPADLQHALRELPTSRHDPVDAPWRPDPDAIIAALKPVAAAALASWRAR